MARVMRRARLTTEIVFFWDDEKHPNGDVPFQYQAVVTVPGVIEGKLYDERSEWIDEKPQLVDTLPAEEEES